MRREEVREDKGRVRKGREEERGLLHIQATANYSLRLKRQRFISYAICIKILALTARLGSISSILISRSTLPSTLDVPFDPPMDFIP